MTKPVRLKDVAAKAKVTEAAASYALSGKPGVSKETAHRIQKIATEMGYRMNPLVSSLMHEVRKTRGVNYQGTLAFLHFHADHNALINDKQFVGRVYRGAIEQSHQHGFSIDPISMIGFESNPERIRQILRARNISGVFIAPVKTFSTALQIIWGNRSAVAIGYSYTNSSITRIAPDNFNAMWRAMGIIHALGYRRPGLLLHDSSIDRRSGYGFTAALKHYCELNSLDNCPPLTINNIENLEPCFSKWQSRYQPDFLFSTASPSLTSSLWGDPLTHCLIGDTVLNDRISMAQIPDHLGAVATDEVCSMIVRNERGIPEIPRTINIPLRLGGFEGIPKYQNRT